MKLGIEKVSRCGFRPGDYAIARSPAIDWARSEFPFSRAASCDSNLDSIHHQLGLKVSWTCSWAVLMNSRFQYLFMSCSWAVFMSSSWTQFQDDGTLVASVAGSLVPQCPDTHASWQVHLCFQATRDAEMTAISLIPWHQCASDWRVRHMKPPLDLCE